MTVNDDTTPARDLVLDPPQRRIYCPLASALELLGERWTLLAVREMGYDEHRFDRIAAFTGASRDILADRLRKLTAAGVVERRQYQEHPPRYEYHLTDAGRRLLPALRLLSEWGERFHPAPAYGNGHGN